MKYFLPTLLLLIIATNTNCQKTILQGKQWNVVDYKVFTPSICTDLYSFQKDTVINSIDYLQLFVKRDTSTNTNWQAQNIFIREDSSNRIYVLDNAQESIIYDFNLIEGDTFQLDYDFSDCELLVYQVDSIQLLNGDVRKRIRLIRSDDPDPTQPWYGYKDWIQGIGSTTSLTHYAASCFTDYSLDLLCFYENDELIYTNPNNQGCYITPVNEVDDDNVIKVFPNPTTDKITIETKSAFLSVKIVNLNGELMVSSQTSTIDVSLFPPGLYFAKIETTKGHKIMKLIVD